MTKLARRDGWGLGARDNPAVLYLLSLSPGARATMSCALRNIAGFLRWHPADCEWHKLGYPETQAIRQWLAGRYAPSTANRMLVALRCVLKQALNLELLSESAFRRVTNWQPVRGSRELAGRALTPGELRTLFAGCDTTTAIGARNAALLAVLYGAGLRRAEAIGLDLVDVDETEGRLRVRRAKGNKWRTVPIPVGARRAIDVWLSHRGREPGPLFYRFHRSGRPFAAAGDAGLMRLSNDGVANVVQRHARKVGVARLSPHDFRRSFVGDLLDNGADLSTVQQMAGHASPTTTARYDRRGMRAMAKAADLLSVPFAS